MSGDESCDTALASGSEGACPVECESTDACRSEVLTGIGCETYCAVSVISQPVDNDGCCPSGADATTDSDCENVCGDGLVTGGEACDTAITEGEGACPSSCEATDACHPAALVGAGCQAECVVTEITAPGHGDGCCPAGADATNDNDCAPFCGNGVVEPGETCEGAGCPTACVAGDACSPEVLVGDPAQCTSACVPMPITECGNGDGCCPSGCDSTNDDSCSASCGNGVLEGNETCDPPGTCPTSCDDANVCTRNVLTGSAMNCNAVCSFPPITAADDGTDGCCPSGANNNTDPNCDPVCGNGVTEAGEHCDAACPTSCTPSANACTPRVLEGSGCLRRCVETTITAPIDGDGCCPAGQTYATDTDCPGVCGNGIVETGETCDDGNNLDFDGCKNCQISDGETQCLADAEEERDETGACIGCMCGNGICRAALDLCYNSIDLAQGGPAAGAPKSELCAAVINCGRAAGCTGTSCYGLVSPGPCRPQIQAAAETTSLATVLSRMNNTAYAVGHANAIGECSESNCEAQCL